MRKPEERKKKERKERRFGVDQSRSSCTSRWRPRRGRGKKKIESESASIKDKKKGEEEGIPNLHFSWDCLNIKDSFGSKGIEKKRRKLVSYLRTILEKKGGASEFV